MREATLQNLEKRAAIIKLMRSVYVFGRLCSDKHTIKSKACIAGKQIKIFNCKPLTTQELAALNKQLAAYNIFAEQTVLTTYLGTVHNVKLYNM